MPHTVLYTVTPTRSVIGAMEVELDESSVFQQGSDAQHQSRLAGLRAIGDASRDLPGYSLGLETARDNPEGYTAAVQALVRRLVEDNFPGYTATVNFCGASGYQA